MNLLELTTLNSSDATTQRVIARDLQSADLASQLKGSLNQTPLFLFFVVRRLGNPFAFLALVSQIVPAFVDRDTNSPIRLR